MSYPGPLKPYYSAWDNQAELQFHTVSVINEDVNVSDSASGGKIDPTVDAGLNAIACGTGQHESVGERLQMIRIVIRGFLRSQLKNTIISKPTKAVIILVQHLYGPTNQFNAFDVYYNPSGNTEMGWDPVMKPGADTQYVELARKVVTFHPQYLCCFNGTTVDEMTMPEEKDFEIKFPPDDEMDEAERRFQDEVDDEDEDEDKRRKRRKLRRPRWPKGPGWPGFPTPPWPDFRCRWWKFWRSCGPDSSSSSDSSDDKRNGGTKQDRIPMGGEVRYNEPDPNNKTGTTLNALHLLAWHNNELMTVKATYDSILSFVSLPVE